MHTLTGLPTDVPSSADESTPEPGTRSTAPTLIETDDIRRERRFIPKVNGSSSRYQRSYWQQMRATQSGYSVCVDETSGSLNPIM